MSNTTITPEEMPSEILKSGRMLTEAEYPGEMHHPGWRLSELQLQPGIETHCLKPDRLWLLTKPDGIWLHYAAVEWISEDDHGFQVQSLWCGHGISDNLRELRHSYFGPDFDGYSYYVDLEYIILVAEKLKTWFDGY